MGQVGEIEELVGDFVVACASRSFKNHHHQMMHILQTEDTDNW
jgi:putative SOS response-associated peptidase YedK